MNPTNQYSNNISVHASFTIFYTSSSSPLLPIFTFLFFSSHSSSPTSTPFKPSFFPRSFTALFPAYRWLDINSQWNFHMHTSNTIIDCFRSGSVYATKAKCFLRPFSPILKFQLLHFSGSLITMCFFDGHTKFPYTLYGKIPLRSDRR